MELALYTTVHPGTRPFLSEWYDSLQAQTDPKFELWIGIDGLSVEEARKAMGGRPSATWIRAEPGDTPAQVRERTWEALIPHADAVIMVDADDVMHPRRVEHARKHVSECDIGACALQLVSKDGIDIGYVMPPSECETTEDVLPKRNIFGLSNTVYRTQVLDEVLPLPEDLTLIDWYLSTQAWLKGHALSVDRAVCMKYRQHESSTLALLPPFTEEDVRHTTKAVRGHFSFVAQNLPPDPMEERITAFREAREEVDHFQGYVLSRKEHLRTYTAELNQLDPLPLWWGCVARTELGYLWNSHTA